MHVHVLSSEGQPLMPTHPAKARVLLKTKKAEVAKGKTGAFTIRLLYETTAYTQPVHVGIDTGSKFVGISAVANGKEVYAKEKLLRDDIKSELEKRRRHRRARRTRKTRYRQPRFDNRTKTTCNRCGTNNVPRSWEYKKRKQGGKTKKRIQTGRAALCRPCSSKKGDGQQSTWLAPSVAHRKDSIIREIEMLSYSLPISRIRIELTSFDSQKMQDPDIQGIEYQESPLKTDGGDNLERYKRREQIRARDKNKCVYCEDLGHEVDHIRGGRGPARTDAIENLAWCCRSCNRAKSGSSLETWRSKLKQGRRKESKKIIANIDKFIKSGYKSKKVFRHSALTHSYKKSLMKELIALYPDMTIQETFGYETNYYRDELALEKSHLIDAGVIATGGKPFTPCGSYIVERQLKKRRPHDFRSPEGKTGQPIIRYKWEYVKSGFRLWDKVKFKHQTGFEIIGYVSSRTEKNLEVRTFHGNKIRRFDGNEIKESRFSKTYREVTLLKPTLSNYIREIRQRKQLQEKVAEPSSTPSGQLLLFNYSVP